MTPRRIIIELHSEWGLPLTFFADVAQLRAMYEPLGCRVTLGPRSASEATRRRRRLKHINCPART